MQMHRCGFREGLPEPGTILAPGWHTFVELAAFFCYTVGASWLTLLQVRRI
jgi:hypothetical protein